MKALIQDTRICQIEKEPFPVAKPLEWVDVPDGTTTQDTWDGKKVIKYKPIPEPIELVNPLEARIKKLEADLATYKAKVDSIKG